MERTSSKFQLNNERYEKTNRAHLLVWLKSQPWRTPNANGEQQKLSFNTRGNAKWYSRFRNSWVFSDKAKHWLTTDPEIVLLGIYSKELKTGLNQNLHLSVYGRFNRDRPNMEATKTSFSRWLNELWSVSTMVSLSKKKKSAIKPPKVTHI